MEKKLYYHGNILTMEEELYAQAVLTENGKISAVGEFEDLKSMAGDARLVDLEGHTLMPSFIDAHSHFSGCANAMLQCSVEDAKNFEDMIQSISAYIRENHIEKGQWVLVRNYDQSVLTENRKPDRYVLDAASNEHPIVLQHKSGHVGVLNSMALEMLGIHDDTPDPEGGRIERENGVATGYMEENAFIQILHRLPGPDQQSFIQAFDKVQRMYASNGITTVQEGMMTPEMKPLYQFLCKEQRLWLDVVGYPAMDGCEDIYREFENCDKKYQDHFKLGGYKIFLDGSPQSRTAWMRTPYVGGNDCGYPVQSLEAVTDSVYYAASRGRQILAHCNGDAAAGQYLDAIVLANERLKKEGMDSCAAIRPVMVHAQLLGLDQIPKLCQLGVIPSFFVAHVYHWGDTHIENFGFSRASTISPVADAQKAGLLYTFHQDSPVIRPNMVETLWCAVNRRTKAGVVLGENERISTLDALKAMTIYGAYQYFEENEKGSIAPGKRADFIILDQNPLDVLPQQLRDIGILETIKDGKTVFCKK